MHTLTACLICSVVAAVPGAAQMRAGTAERDITPQAAVPLWGYTAMNRPENLSTGTLDPLMAKVLVLEGGGERVALVGLDLGRAPEEGMVDRLRTYAREEAGIAEVLFVGSHTHHGPAVEVDTLDVDALPEAFRALAAYYAQLEAALREALAEAAAGLQPAQWGWASAESELNRNRHTETPPIPRDPELFVLRLDQPDGTPLATVVNFAAHPTIHPPQNNRFTAEFPGVMMRAVEAATGAPCLFLQGAAGDLQCEIDDTLWGKQDFIEPIGQALAKEVLALWRTVETKPPVQAGIRFAHETFTFGTREGFDVTSEEIRKRLRLIYTPPLANHYLGKYADGRMRPRMHVALLNGDLALVTGSGEFFSDLSVRLKARAPVKTIFLGYCNGHDLYFPTRRGAEEGGYGAEPPASFVEVGAGEAMIERAIALLDEMAEAR